MSLVVWLPLTKDLRQQGLSDVTVINNGATFNSAGKLGGCYGFNRSSSNYLKIDNPITTATNGVSIAFWVKIPSNASGNNQIVHIGNGAGWNNNRCTCFIYQSSSSLIFSCSDGQGTSTANSTQYSCKSSALTLNSWTHVVCTYGTGKMKIYLNGVLDKEYTTTIIPSFANTSYIGVGAAPNAGEPATIYVNDVRVYDHCLSPMEVKQISQGLVLHYPLNRNGWGQENIVRNSNKFKTGGHASGVTPSVEVDGTYKVIAESGNSNYSSSWWWEMTGIEDSFVEDEPFTVSFWIKSSDANKTKPPTIYLKSGMGYYSMQGSVSANYSQVYYTGTWKKTNSLAPHLGWSGLVGTYYICHWKIEKGSIPTSWCPNSSDALAITMGLNSTIEYDCSGFCNNGTRTGTFNWTSDTPKYAVSTKITPNSNIQFTPMLAGAYSWTIAAWIKPAVANNDGKAWFSLEQNTYWQVTCYSNQLGIRDNSIGGTGTRKNYSFGTIAANTWMHLVATYDNGTLKLYNNGVLQNTNTVGGTYLNAMNNGRWGSAVQDGYYWNGQISDARLYATALSADDVKSLYQNSAYIDSSGNVYGAVHSEV